MPDGGFWVSQMGSATGSGPGRLVRIFPDAAGINFSNLREFPTNPPSGFNPHGFAIDASQRYMVSADYVNYKSTITGPNVNSQFLGSGGFLQYRHSLRVFEMPNFTQPNPNLVLTGVMGMWCFVVCLEKSRNTNMLCTHIHADEQESMGFMTVKFVGNTTVAVSGGMCVEVCRISLW